VNGRWAEIKRGAPNLGGKDEARTGKNKQSNSNFLEQFLVIPVHFLGHNVKVRLLF
jgi:hypothetical protein